MRQRYSGALSRTEACLHNHRHLPEDPDKKGFVEHKKGSGKLLIYTPLITKEKYRRQVMEEVKDDFFGNSFKSMFSFFVKEEHLTAEEIKELMEEIGL